MKKQQNQKKNAFFITFEGPEGAGKSTQIRLLKEYLEQRNRPVCLTREPGGTGIAEQLRAIVKNHDGSEIIHDETELLLIEAARAQHVRERIRPALNRGITVLCDRFCDSTTAYQGGARGIDAEAVLKLNAFAVGDCMPDLTILLDLPPERGFERTRKREATQGEYDRFELEKTDFHHKVRLAFLAIAKAEPQRVKVVDADRGAEEIQAEIRKIVDELI